MRTILVAFASSQEGLPQLGTARLDRMVSSVTDVGHGRRHDSYGVSSSHRHRHGILVRWFDELHCSLPWDGGFPAFPFPLPLFPVLVCPLVPSKAIPWVSGSFVSLL